MGRKATHALQVRDTTDADLASIYLQGSNDPSTKQSLSDALQRIGATATDPASTKQALEQLSEECLTVTMGDRVQAIFDPANEQNPAPDEDFNADLVWIRSNADAVKVKAALDSWYQMQMDQVPDISSLFA